MPHAERPGGPVAAAQECATNGPLEIALGAEIIARHRRSYVRGDVIYDPLHYLSLLEKMPGALDQAGPLRGWKLDPAFDALRRLLEARFDAVKHLLLARIERRPAHLDLTRYPHLTQPLVAATRSADYATLLAGEAGHG